MIPLRDSVFLALRAMRRSVLRTALTVLGILIGVAAVVAITALGEGGRDAILSKIQSMGSNVIVVTAVINTVSGAQGAKGTGLHLSDDDARAIAREAGGVKAVAPLLTATVQVVHDAMNVKTQVAGVTLPYFTVRSWELERGELWTNHDEAMKTKVCVLGATVARKLWGGANPVGQLVRIGRAPYRVLGVLEKKGESQSGMDQDDVVAMPIGSLRARVLKAPPGFVGRLMVSANSPDAIDRATRQIEAILRQRHRVAPGAKADFEVGTQKHRLEQQNRIAGKLTTLLVVIAVVSLVVGGIGIMNIMLVSVTERTREIGIRMAIGACERDILVQFLVEALVLALLGGVLGAGLGAAGALLGSRILGWSVGINVPAVVGSLAMSALTGIAFGLLPARRGARLDPIVALKRA